MSGARIGLFNWLDNSGFRAGFILQKMIRLFVDEEFPLATIAFVEGIKALKRKVLQKQRFIGVLMKTAKRQLTNSYQDFLVDRLQDSAHAAGFIAAVLEEKEPEPQLLSSALEDVMAAKIKSGTLSESAQQNYEKLNHRLAESGGAEIYALVDLLEAWGMQLTIAHKS
jgi:DNA-binding phage protein